MVRVITQETFDEVVRENIDEFDMNPEEALKEATAQFEAQGVDLSNIMKDLRLGSGDNHLVTSVVNELRDLCSKPGADDEDIIKELEALKKECQKDLAHRVRAGKDGAYNITIDLLTARQKIYLENKSEKEGRVIVAALNALIALMEVQPDLLEAKGIDFIMSTLDKIDNESILITTLQWTSVCCMKHEMNRQRLFEKDIGTKMKTLLLKYNTNLKLISEVLQVVRKLTLDDDVRVEFGKAHEHAKEMGVLMLDVLANLLKQNSKPPLAAEIMLTIAALLVRNELCAAVAASVGDLLKVLTENYDNVAVVQQAYKLITALAGNDDVKRKLVSSGIAPIVVTLLTRHSSNQNATSLSLKCIAALCLREPTHSQEFLDNGAPEAIVSCLNVHRDVASIQKNGCWAIRNMVARCRDQTAKFHELGVEAILNDAYQRFGKDFGFDIKSALRDLDCDVKLDEPWTGKGVQMEQ